MCLRTKPFTVVAIAAIFFVWCFLPFHPASVASNDAVKPVIAHPRQRPIGIAGDRRAYATFLAGRYDNDFDDDRYFTATRAMAYQLLHQPRTRTKKSIPFIVLVTPHVSEAKRAILKAEGATIVPVELIESTRQQTPGLDRWLDIYSKLHLFSLTQFDRILYLDTDMLITRCLDDVWDEEVALTVQQTDLNSSTIRSDEARLPETYLFAGVGENYSENHSFPPEETDYLNAGFFMLRPDPVLFAYYRSLIELPDRYDEFYMEQNLLNYAHRWDGPMPWRSFEPGKWNCNFPGLQDLEGQTATLHDKFWEEDNREWIDRTLVEMWWRVQGEMEGYWQRERTREEEKGFWNIF